MAIQDSQDDSVKKVGDDFEALMERDISDFVTVALATVLKVPSPIPEKFADWLLAGVAAALAIFINDLDKLQGLIPSNTLTGSIRLLAAGLSMGVIGKALGLLAKAQLTAFENVTQRSNETVGVRAQERSAVFDRAEKLGVDLNAQARFNQRFRERYLQTFIPITAWWIGRQMNRQLAKPNSTLAVYTTIVRKRQWRVIFIGLSVLFAVSGATLAAVSIKLPEVSVAKPASQEQMQQGSVVPSVNTKVIMPSGVLTHRSQPNLPASGHSSDH
jgi:hypothetical protein